MTQTNEHGPSPWWAGYLLTSPLRRLVHDPKQILSPFVQQGMHVLEPGPGRGFFTLELARLVGPQGRVFASELQSAMLEGLRTRAKHAKFLDRIDVRQASRLSLEIDDLTGSIDFALSFAVAHEASSPVNFFAEIASALKPQALLLLAEPDGHVSAKYFSFLREAAKGSGLTQIDSPQIDGCHVALMLKS